MPDETQPYATRLDMKPADRRFIDPALLEQRLRDMTEGLTEAIDREVERRRREGLPIHVFKDGKVVDLQEEPEG